MAKRDAIGESRKRKGDAAAIAGRLEEACTIFENVCRSNPLDVEAWTKLGVTLRRRGDFETAETCCRKAIQLQPDIGFGHYALGSVLHCQGKYAEAISSYRRAITLQPNFPDSHLLLGNALRESGAMNDAIASYRNALSLRPNFPEALSSLGGILVDIGSVDEAEQFLQTALSLQPANHVALTNLSALLLRKGKDKEALETFRHALLLNPDSVEVIGGLAGLLEKTGKLEESAHQVERGLALAPTDPALNLVAAQLARREKRLQEAADRLEDLCRQQLPRDTEAECRLLLGQIYDEMNDAARAYPLIVEGKRLKAMASFSKDRKRNHYLDHVATLSALATEALVQCQRPASHASDPDAPVFLIGFPRSGTTLLEQVLDSHPAIQTMEERGAVTHMFNEFTALTRNRDHHLESLSSDAVLHCRDAYFAEVKRNIDRKPATLLVDKHPLHTVGVPVIWRMFPEAKFILAIRHPCDVCLSCLMQNFAVNEGMASFFNLEDTARTYAAVMSAWLKYVRLLPLNYHRIRYEDLIGNFQTETAQLLTFLGVPWDDAVLCHTDHARNKGTINTPSYHQVTQPIYQRAKYRWQRYREAFEPVMPILQPFIEYFGYEETAEPAR